ncbi:hypothetical protein FCIRC_8893 [Fusarium circinatum]|uniref:Fungal N-terminal domain-containing protein n=1 Tax=Fusarium circinatum TaxID=48490 RepID=A0A8H5WPM5_FUSCI|nr:hypothetical protein FCIRC_8893 [Fusarium circinatum]
MGDPFSIATGVAGLVSLGITVCDGLHKYFSAIKDRKDDLAIVTQNLALFKFHIFAVQSSASKLGHHHSPAIYGLGLSLINCEMQLKCLDTLLNELRPTENLSLTKEVWRKQRLMARYPFDRKKLVQLQEYLSRANTTLSSFIQALNLDINIRTGDELEAFRTSLEALHINTQTAMRTITTKLDVIGPKVEPSTLQLLPSKIEDITTSSSKSTVLHQAAVGVAETRICDLGNRRSIQDPANVHSKPRYLQNSELERRLCEKLADMDCTCGTSNSKSSHRLASRTYRFWGGLTVSRRGDVRANHRPGCVFFQRSQKDIWRTSVTYFGLLSLFSESFTISLTQEYPGGPYGISFGLQPCNIVDSSPALRLFDLHPQGNGNIFHKYANVNDLLADNIIKELRDIYESGNASPFDIDQNGNNVAHECLEQEAPPLLDKVPELFILLSPLDYALSYSKIYCNAPDQWTDCEGCTCYVAVQLLLEADCKVIIAQERLDSLALCSLKARKLFFKHLKDRRQRLRDVALSVLPEEVLRQYGVATNLLPDKTAVKLWSELQKAQDEQDRRVWLPDSLSPCDIGSSFIPKSIFQFPHHLQVTELALDYGFTPRDENGVQVLLSGSNVIPYQLSRSLEFIKYLDWLLRHNLSTERSSKPFRFSVLHRIASFIGVLMSFKDSKTSNLMQWDANSPNDLYDEEEWRELLGEDRELINQLEALDEEFGSVFDRQNVSIADFLWGYWLTRMREVLRELNKPLTDDDKYEFLEAGVVLDKDETIGPECRAEWTE